MELKEWLGENRWGIGGELPSDLTAAKTSSLRRTFSMSWTSECLRRKSLWASTRCGCWVPSSLSMAAVDPVADSLSLERVRWVFFLFGFFDSLWLCVFVRFACLRKEALWKTESAVFSLLGRIHSYPTRRIVKYIKCYM